mgnify:CR=1 FL=1
MGSLKPGASYIYEKENGVTYAREHGAPASDRFEVGRDAGRADLDEHNLVIAMRAASKTNPSLRKALERAIMLYKMTDDYKDYEKRYGRKS